MENLEKELDILGDDKPDMLSEVRKKRESGKAKTVAVSKKSDSGKSKADKAKEEKAAAKRRAEKVKNEKAAAEKTKAQKVAEEKARTEKAAEAKAKSEKSAAEKKPIKPTTAEKADESAAEEKKSFFAFLRKAEADDDDERAAEEKAAAEKARAEKLAAEKAKAEKAAAEKAEAERLKSEKVAAEKAAAEKAKAEKAEKARAEKAAAEFAKAEKKLAADKARQERAEKKAAEENSDDKKAFFGFKNKTDDEDSDDNGGEMLENTVEAIKDAFDSALDEEVSEIAEVTSAPEEDEPVKPKPQTSFKRKFYFTVGVVVSILSLIGFIWAVVFLGGVIHRIADNTAQKTEFAEFIYPVVMTDPASFETKESLPSRTIIQAAVWDLLMYGDLTKYPSEYGTITVPAVDIEQHANRLFGAGLDINHQNVGDATLMFYYDSETKSYNIPEAARYFTYSPEVTEIRRDGSVYHLTVAYIPPTPDWVKAKTDGKETIEKYMEYVVEKTQSGYCLLEIKEIEGMSDNSDYTY